MDWLSATKIEKIQALDESSFCFVAKMPGELITEFGVLHRGASIHTALKRVSVGLVSALLIAQFMMPRTSLADPIPGDTYVDFEVGSDGTPVTAALMTSATHGNLFSGWQVSSSPNLIISSSASYRLFTPTIVDGTTYPGTGTRGLRAIMSGNSIATLKIPSPGYQLSIGFHFRFNGPQVNYSPRDVVGLRSDPTGNYQFLQIYDGDDPLFHAHWQPGGAGDGNDIRINRNQWYWVTMNHVAGGGTMRVSFYDAEDDYGLVGTSTGSVSSGTLGATTIQIGCIKYASGGSQSVDFDNVIINTSGVFPLGPGSGSGPVPAPPAGLSVVE